MPQFNVTLNDTPQAVAGPGAAMFEGRDKSVKYWIGTSAPAADILPFEIEMGAREPVGVPDNHNLYLAGSGQAVVFKSSETV